MSDSRYDTHTVFNQSPEFGGVNLWQGDPLLQRIGSALPAASKAGYADYGAWLGARDTIELARLANRHLPQLRTHDNRGNRIDLVDFHPSYHAFMRKSVAAGLLSSVWEEGGEEQGHRHVARGIRFYMTSGIEMGHLCPVTMTHACVAAMQESPEIAEEWLPLIASRKYDPSNKPPVAKTGVTIGMGMTEKQGGTDVRANTTLARHAGEGVWQLTGHKWFFSAPMCDAFLILAQVEQGGRQEGLGCFLVPRRLSDGRQNGLRLQRLKDKLGNRSNASSEVEICGSYGQLIGEAGRGMQTILRMVTLTRLDCALGSAGLMRTALWEAVEHARHRMAMGERLIDQPLMQRVLADMAIDMAAATALTFRLAQSFDRAGANPAEAAYARLMTPVIKYWVCKLAPPLVQEAMECLGGNGYVEEGNLARLYRESPLNAIWEGSGNVMCLDVLRVLKREPEALEAVLSSLERDLGGDKAAKTIDVIRTAARMALGDEGSARILTEQMALTAAAAELHRIGLSELADAFVETRLGGLWRNTYGMLDSRQNAMEIIDTLFPERD
ncbi:MAG: acyl-CoA dehydrogenase family protein [Nitratireductor sp.]|nr:acyl-CoA dehydrogenase family protein [Nitratireductor sp.]